MIKLVYSLRDIKSDTFGNPIAVVSLGALLRDLQDVVRGREMEQILAKHPGDFHLFKLGTFDDQKGVFELLSLPDFVLDCGSLVEDQVGREAAAPLAAVN